MGFRFRKSVKAGPFRINFSKSGVGWSVGGKGFRYTKKANGGTRYTVKTPINGLSYVKETGSNSKKNKHHGCLWWYFIGWWWILFKLIFLTISALFVKILIPNIQKLINKIVGQAAYQNDVSSFTDNVKWDKNSVIQPIQSYSNLIPNENLALIGGTSFVDKVKKFYYSQFDIKDNSVFDKLAKWIDKTFYGSDYNLTSEKLMIIALVTNILGLHRIYAGHKFAAVIGWLYLLLAFQSSVVLPILLIWVIIDMTLIYFGSYGRLKDKQKFDFNKFKLLITYRQRARAKTISGVVSVVAIVFIATISPNTNNTANQITETTNSSVIVVSQTDNSTTSTITLTTTSTATPTDAIVDTAESLNTVEQPTDKTQKIISTTGFTTTTVKKSATTTKEKSTKYTTTKKKTTTKKRQQLPRKKLQLLPKIKVVLVDTFG